MSKCAFLRAKLAQTVADLRQASSVEKGTTLVKAGFLASPKTFARNVVGNGAMAGVEHFITKPTAATLDYFMAVAKSASQRFAVPARQFRTLAFPGLDEFKFGQRGFREGLTKAVDQVRTGVDPEAITDKYDVTRVSFKTPALNRAIHAVFDVMDASDKPWYAFSFNTSLFNSAQVAAIREGLHGPARTARVNQLLAAPTDEMVMRAVEEAQYATFKNKTVLGQAASRLKESFRTAGTSQAAIDRNPRVAAMQRVTGKALYGASELALPFTSVPTAVAGVALDYSPAGFIKTLAMQLPKEARGRAIVGAARAGLGTAATFGLGYALAKEGKITGSLPSSPNERAQWDAEGKIPNALNVNGRWYSLMPLSPVALPALLGANLYQSSVAHPYTDAVDVAGQTLAFQAKTLSEQTFLQGVRSLTDALNDPSRAGPRFVAGLVPVPAVVGQVAAGLDPTLRSTDGVADRLQSRLPGLSSSLPERRDQFGRTMRRNEGGIAGFAKELLDITSSRASTEDAVTKELDRLRVFPGLPSKTVRIQKTPIERTPEEYNRLLADLGPIVHRAMQQTIASPMYQALSDEDRATVLRRLVGRLEEAANNEFKAQKMRTGVFQRAKR